MPRTQRPGGDALDDWRRGLVTTRTLIGFHLLSYYLIQSRLFHCCLFDTRQHEVSLMIQPSISSPDKSHSNKQTPCKIMRHDYWRSSTPLQAAPEHHPSVIEPRRIIRTAARRVQILVRLQTTALHRLLRT
jgi:hypothetical protein